MSAIRPSTKLVNLRDKYPNYNQKIDRTTQFGNPFHIGKDGTRDEVIKKYRIYFTGRIRKDLKFQKAVKALKGKTLACWCTPLHCHGDVIIEYLEAL